MASTPNVNTATFSDFVRLAPYMWTQGVESIRPEARQSGIFRVGIFPANSGNTREYNEFDTNEYASYKGEGDQAEQSRIQLGYTKVGRVYRFGEDVGITWEARNQGKYPEALRRIKDLAKKVSARMELDLQHRITFGTATSYTDMDGRSVDTAVGDTLALFSTAHTLRGSSSTYRNRLAGNPQLSKGSLEAIEKQISENTLNQFGEKMTAPFDILWTTDDPNTMNTARELLQASAAVSAPNAGVPNVYQAKYKHVKLSRVATDANGGVDATKAKYWGLASSDISTAYLDVLEEPNLREPKEITDQKALGTDNVEDVSTDTITYSARGSWSICVVGSRFIHFSSGDGTA